MILDIFWRHRRRYGARRIAMDLAEMGEACGVARVAKLLEKQGLRAIQPKSYRPRTTNSRHRLGYNANLLKDRAAPSRINEVWVGDITYIPLRGGRFGYMSVLMDLYSRRIVGWEYQESMTDALVLASLRKAIRDRQPSAELIHHSDRGGQYASTEYRSVLRRAAMRQSLSAAADCYDNAFMESCFGTLKTELENTPTAWKRSASCRNTCVTTTETAATRPSATPHRPSSRNNRSCRFKRLHCPRNLKHPIRFSK